MLLGLQVTNKFRKESEILSTGNQTEMYIKADKFCINRLNGRLLYAENVDEFKYLYKIFYEHPEFSRIPVSMSISNNELNVYAETDLLNENIHYGAGVHQFLVSSENKGKYWIGATYKSGKWVWEDDEVLDPIKFSLTSGSSFECLAVVNGKLQYYRSCSENNEFVCEYSSNFNYVKSNEIKRVVCKGYYNLAELQAAIEDDTEDTVELEDTTDSGMLGYLKEYI
ncbi:unnamed protein product [Enterobius vermicularis]|uniref:C-type lectin domain-containing protein n=1 Tax=Enterobius vermicularis TaxID=51028 RepID=A0A158Q9P3_ENTVE|nr:unnamed protein product [Enterobius vermicularis]